MDALWAVKSNRLLYISKKSSTFAEFFYNGILLLEKIRIYEECKMDDMRGVLGDDDAIS